MPDARKWTFVVHHNADFFWDVVHAHILEELAAVGSTPEVDLLVLRDGFESEPGGLYHLVRGQAPTPHPDWPAGELDMSDPQVLARLMRFARDRFPSDRTALVLACHGYGWAEGWYRWQRRTYPTTLVDRWLTTWSPEAGVGRTLARAGVSARAIRESLGVTRCLCPDVSSGTEMTAAGLRAALAQVHADLGRPLDLLAFDACSMQMAEIAFQLAGHVLHQVGPEWYGLSWPYAAIAEALAVAPDMDAGALAGTMVDLYAARRLAECDEAFTLSAVDLGRIEGIRGRLDALARALLAPGVPLSAVRDVVQDTVLVEVGYSYRDLGDFAGRLAAHPLPDPVRRAAGELQAALDGGFVTHCRAGGSAEWPLERTAGLSVFLPLARAPLDPNGATYSGLEMSARTAWRQFLLQLTA